MRSFGRVVSMPQRTQLVRVVDAGRFDAVSVHGRGEHRLADDGIVDEEQQIGGRARELVPRNKKIIASVVGNTEDEIVKVASILDRAGVKIVELNLADDYVMNSVAPFASLERLNALIGRVRGKIGAALAVKLPPKPGAIEAGAIAELMKETGVAVAVCANDLPKDLEIDIASGRITGAARPLSQAHKSLGITGQIAR